MRVIMVAALVAAAGLNLLSLSQAWSHEGHDESLQPTQQGNAAPRGQASSDQFELVAELVNGQVVVYLDRFATNEPIKDANLTITIANKQIQAASAGRGVYQFTAPWNGQPQTVDMVFTVVAGDQTDILPLTLALTRAQATHPHEDTPLFGAWRASALTGIAGLFAGILLMSARRRSVVATGLVVFTMLAKPFPTHAHDGEDHGGPSAPASASSNIAQRLPDGTIFVPKPVQRIFDLRTVMANAGVFQRTRELPGRIIADPNASGLVQAAIGGRLSAPDGGFPRLGKAVNKGDVLAFVTPPIQAVDASDMRQKQGELDQQIAVAERRLKRFETLAGGVVPRSQLEDTQTEVQSLKDRRAQIEKSRREPEALIAPLDGVIADGGAVAGQMAQPNAVVFNIIDPTKLWVEALSFDAVSNVQIASARLANGQRFSIDYRGSGFADRNQSVPVHFAMTGDLSGLRVGQFVTVALSTSETRRGIALPRNSLVRGLSGQDLVFEHVSAEVFRALPVRTEPLDSERILVLAGLEPGKRVVTQAADLLDHVR